MRRKRVEQKMPVQGRSGWGLPRTRHDVMQPVLVVE